MVYFCGAKVGKMSVSVSVSVSVKCEVWVGF